MQILLEHNTTHFTLYFDNVAVKSETPLYKVIDLDLTKLVDGDYTLTLFNNSNQILTKELIRIGNYQIKEYKTEKKYTTYARK